MADLGVPQHRDRLIVMGVRRDLGVRLPVLESYAGRHVTVADALDAHPLAPDSPNHEIGLDSADVVERLRMIPPGGNYTVIPEGHPLAVRGLISHVYRRLDPTRPSYTIIAGGGGGTHGYHHREPRRLSNREKARLQTFPDDFVFEAGTTGKSAYPRVRKQVGNAVPPRAAQAIVGAMAGALREAGLPTRPARELREARRRAIHLGAAMPAEAAAAGAIAWDSNILIDWLEFGGILMDDTRLLAAEAVADQHRTELEALASLMNLWMLRDIRILLVPYLIDDF